MIRSRNILLTTFLLFFCSVAALPIAPEDLVMYPDHILYNGKIVTVDNPDFTTNLGTIAQAIAIRGGKVLAVGPDAEIRALAGPQTKSVDLKGANGTAGIDCHSRASRRLGHD